MGIGDGPSVSKRPSPEGLSDGTYLQVWPKEKSLSIFSVVLILRQKAIEGCTAKSKSFIGLYSRLRSC